MSASQSNLMRPRALGGKSASFAAAKPRNHDGEPPQKKFKATSAPKGTKLAKGYVDRARERQLEPTEVDDEKQKRLKELGQLLKDEKIDRQTFEKLQDEIGVGGDTSSTHLVKGLDFKLLERIRRGEDVHAKSSPQVDELNQGEVESESNVDDLLDEALDRDFQSNKNPDGQVESELRPDAGQGRLSQPATMSRDDILKQLKQRRKQGLVAGPETKQEPSLDHSKFRKVEASKPQKERFTETVDGRRREVLVITDREGKVKRKTRWLEPEPGPTAQKHPTIPALEVWGGDLPEETLALQTAAAERDAAEPFDEDIFGGVPQYDPTEGLEDDDEEEEETKNTTASAPKLTDHMDGKRRKYFETGHDEPAAKAPHDPSILAALKRAAQLRAQDEGDGDSGQADRRHSPTSGDRNAALLKRLQQQSGQDDMDLDMAFDGNTRADDDDDEPERQKLSVWKGIGQQDDDDEGGGQAKGAKRKRGGKKKKGDKNSFADVMSVIAGRRK